MYIYIYDPTHYILLYDTWYMIYTAYATYHVMLTVFFGWANPGVPPLRFTQKWFVGSWLFMLFEHWLGDSPGYDTTNTQPDAGEPWIFDMKSHVVYETWEKMGCQVWNKTKSGFDGIDSGTNICIHYTCIYVTYVYVLWGIIAVEPRGMIILTKDLHG